MKVLPCLFLLCFMLLPAIAQTDPFKADLIRQINLERAKEKLSPLQPDPYLMEVARLWASDMAKKDKLAHRKNMGLIMEKAGYAGLNENLYFTTFTLQPNTIVEAWLNSSGHRKNLLAPRMTLVGIGYARSGNGAHYVVFNSAVKTPPLLPAE